MTTAPLPTDWQLRSRRLALPHPAGPLRRPLVMGIVNVTPDSFSDGGRHAAVDAAVAHGLRLVAEGADLLDVGGESTRPFSTPVEADEEIRRTAEVVRRLARESGVPVSIDTSKAAVAEHALDFRSLADVERLQALLQQLKQRQRPLQRLVVVGAGPSGVELICKLADLLEGSTILELVEQGPELLPNGRSFNRDQARSALLRRDIHLRTGTRVERIDATGLELVRGGPSPLRRCIEPC